MPKTVEEALATDARQGNHLWCDALEKEMKTVKVACKPCEHPSEGHVPPQETRSNQQKCLIGHTKIERHMIFDAKPDGSFTRKCRCTVDRLQVELPRSMTCLLVVSRESVHMAFLLAGLNNLEVSACDTLGAHLNAPTGERIWFAAAGLECGDDEGSAMIMMCALNGTKLAAKAWADFFRKSLIALGCTLCKADPNICM